jgi:hypothetical protein
VGIGVGAGASVGSADWFPPGTVGTGGAATALVQAESRKTPMASFAIQDSIVFFM